MGGTSDPAPARRHTSTTCKSHSTKERAQFNTAESVSLQLADRL